MLIGIKPCIGPELLKTLAQMGHGDELVLADAYYPGHTNRYKLFHHKPPYLFDE